MLLSIAPKRYNIIVDKKVLDIFREYNIFFSNSGVDRFRYGQKIYFNEDCIIEPWAAFYGGDQVCSIGSMSYHAFVPRKYGSEVKVGRFSSLGPFDIPGPRHPVEAATTSVFAYNRSHSFVKHFSESLASEKKPWGDKVRTGRKGSVVIDNDVWIGGNVVINPGIKIGTGSVVAANSVVTKNIPPYEIWGGNPAKCIKKRFPQEIIDELLLTEWWNYDPKDLRLLPFSDPELFIKELKNASTGWAIYRPITFSPFEVFGAQSLIEII